MNAEEQPEKAERQYYRVTINAPIHKVWAELTRQDAVLPFFFNSVCKTPSMEKGSPVRMVSKNGKFTAVAGDILEFDPPHRYAHSFKFTSLDDPPCVVIYELKEIDAHTTEFTLISEGVPAGTKSEGYMKQGGDFITANFKAFVETGKPTPGGSFALFMMGLTAFMTPSSCKSENWPFDREIK